jgi:sugar phosphate isomerase/epimerase
MKDLAVVISNDNKNVTPYETIDAIKEAGFKNVFVQWYDDDYKVFSVPQEEQIRYAREKGLNIIFAHLGYRNMNSIWLDGEEGEGFVKRYLNDLDELKKQNINLVMMHACVGWDTPELSKIGLDRFKRICEHAKELGINLAFENTKTKGYLEYLIDNIDLDNVGICYDCGHDHCHFKDDFNFEKFKDKIMCIHIHDNYGEIDDHLIPGDGTVNYDYVLNGLKKANYNGYFTMELCYRNDYLNEDLVSFYKDGYNKGLKLLKKYNNLK